MKPSIIALLTDFGLDDWYVGVMKGAILTVNPDARIVDVTHSVPRYSICAGSFAVLSSREYFPRSAIFVGVVDPGVGGTRRILCVRSGGRTYLAPDNGILTGVLERDGCDEAVSVENREFFHGKVSSTFHGRDVFAPVAGHLSLGLDPRRLGPVATDLKRCLVPAPGVTAGSAVATIRWVDHFGNLICDCSDDFLGEVRARWGEVAVDVGNTRGIAVVRTYESATPGKPLAIVGSSGYLEVSVREGSASSQLGAGLGDSVTLRRA